MSHLLDVNALLAAIWTIHPHYASTDTWLKGKNIAICPLVELGFLRISMIHERVKLVDVESRTKNSRKRAQRDANTDV